MRSGRRRSHPAEAVRELFEPEVLAAKERIVGLMQSGSERIALDAASAILDRAFGKPRQVAEPSAEERRPGPIEFYEVVRPGGPPVSVEEQGPNGG